MFDKPIGVYIRFCWNYATRIRRLIQVINNALRVVGLWLVLVARLLIGLQLAALFTAYTLDTRFHGLSGC